MENQYKVKTGDTLQTISRELNVPIQNISGFRSNDPNTIFPGEVLTIGQPNVPVVPQTPNPAVPQTQNQAQIVPQTKLPEGATFNAQQPTPQAQPQNVQPQVAQPQIVEPQVAQPQVATPEQPPVNEDAPVAETFTTPSGAIVSPEGELIEPAEQPTVLDSFGFSGEAIDMGFQQNPFGTLQGIIEQVGNSLGLSDVRENITKISNDIESLANERDDEIAKIEDNPWISGGSKRERIQKIADRYEQKIANRTNKLTLLQNSYDSARQQAQFVATTAINLYDRQRQFDYNAVQDALDRAEKTAEAQAKLNEPLSVAEAKALGVPYGTTASEAYGITPRGSTSEDTSFSNTQVNKGASIIGVPIETFKTFSEDTKNIIINNKDFTDLFALDLADIKDGTQTKQEVIDNLNAQENMPDTIKNDLISVINNLTSPTPEPSKPSVWSKLWSNFTGNLGALKNLD